MFYKANVTGDVSHARWVRYREGYVLDQAMVSLVVTIGRSRLWDARTVYLVTGRSSSASRALLMRR